MRIAKCKIVSIMVAALVVGCAGAARAVQVTVEVTPREIFLGDQFSIEIVLTDTKNSKAPQLPDLPGARVSYGGLSNSTRIIDRNIETSQTYTYRVTPESAGMFKVPPFAVEVDGRSYSFGGAEVAVLKSETGDLLFVEVKSPKESFHVGEKVSATLEVWIRPYRDRSLNVTLGEDDMWSLINDEATSWGAFNETLRELYNKRQRPRGEIRPRESDGTRRQYFVYSITRELWADWAGSLDVGNVKVVVNYPLTLERARSFFEAGLSVTRSRPVTATVASTPIQILPLPDAGQPDYFTGAVGRFSMEVAAKPTNVRVGDPITLTLTLRGDGRLETLQPPPLAQLPELLADFTVPDEALAGVMEGDAKRFTQTLRAKRDEITEIPAIPFAFFLPEFGRYETVTSEPIPIRVEKADRLSTSAIIDAEGGTAPAARRLTETQDGLLANYVDMDEVLNQQGFEPDAFLWTSVTAPPVIYSLGWLVVNRRQRLAGNQALQRRRAARGAALSKLSGEKSSISPSAASDAIRGYVADRLNLPEGALTRSEVVGAVRSRGATEKTVQNLDELLSRIEGLHYGSEALSSDGDITEQARQLILTLEKERL